MATVRDIRVATTLAHTVHSFQTTARKSVAGIEFEQALYRAVLQLQDWRYATPPDQFNLGLAITPRTGTRYEHDGMVATSDVLYILEAKWLASPVTREVVGITVQKLLDTMLGSYSEIGHIDIKSVIVAGKCGADAAAFRHAAAFGILLVTPERPTPFEVLYRLDQMTYSNSTTRNLRQECEILADMLWRPFNTILSTGPTATSFTVQADHIYGADRSSHLLANWDECLRTALALGLLTAAPTGNK